jgi:hypothetical protein
MNETEVKKVDKEVMDGIESDPEFELDYLENRRKGLKAELKGLGIEWRAAKYTRDDAQMEKVRKMVKKVKGLISWTTSQIRAL